VRFEVELIQLRSRTCRMRASAMVDGKLAVEAELSCIVVDRESPNLPPGVPVATGEQ
jgi:3-hydroxymyristoyl/3-hydroxydecanoyl-(acyl carrier protein) dehydratase